MRLWWVITDAMDSDVTDRPMNAPELALGRMRLERST